MSQAKKPKSAPSCPTSISGNVAVKVSRFKGTAQTIADDQLAVEAPLEILLHHPALGPEPESFGATMRTPGDDEALAAGLLYGEGVIEVASDIDAIETSTRRPNVVNVRLNYKVQLDLQAAVRRFSAGSSCGICGTTGLDDVIARTAILQVDTAQRVELAVLLRLPRIMRESQLKFGSTGGIHASALFDMAGTLLAVTEDIGRHNALDKLVGMNLLAGRLPLTDRIVLLSGRVSFELIQKTLRAGAAIIAAIGAPSSLAVSLAQSTGLTLVGFVRDTGFNVYTHVKRVKNSS